MRYEAHENHPYGWEIMEMAAIPVRTFAVDMTKEAASAVVAELNSCVEKYAFAAANRDFIRDRLEADRMLFAKVISSILTEPQLDSKPQCLNGLSIREAWVSWNAGFSPIDKMKKDQS